MRFLMKRYITFGLLALLFTPMLLSAQNGTNQPIRLATTTSTENSGLLAYLLPEFKQDSGYQVHVIAVGTGKALRLGRNGDVDVVLVHAPDAEQKFVASGFGVKRHPVMYNDFVIIGSKGDPANIKQSRNLADAFARIAKSASSFISRGDDSGTHKKEQSIWHSSNIQTDGRWYREVGQGMGKVIQIANELGAYTLADRGTWLVYKNKVQDMDILFEGDEQLFNPYSIIAVNPEKYPDINQQGASTLIAWITSAKGQKMIGNYKKFDQVLFTPSAKNK
jgi:tungstate transport system substrate-binding protein